MYVLFLAVLLGLVTGQVNKNGKSDQEADDRTPEEECIRWIILNQGYNCIQGGGYMALSKRDKGLLGQCYRFKQRFPIDTIYVLDSSVSMRKLWGTSLSFVQTLINHAAHADSNIGIVQFASNAETYLEFDTPKELKTKKVSELAELKSMRERTNTNAGLSLAADMFDEQDNDNPKLIIMITDGNPSPLRHSPCKKFDTMQRLNDMKVNILTFYVAEGGKTKRKNVKLNCLWEEVEGDTTIQRQLIAFPYGDTMKDIINDPECFDRTPAPGNAVEIKKEAKVDVRQGERKLNRLQERRDAPPKSVEFCDAIELAEDETNKARKCLNESDDGCVLRKQGTEKGRKCVPNTAENALKWDVETGKDDCATRVDEETCTVNRSCVFDVTCQNKTLRFGDYRNKLKTVREESVCVKSGGIWHAEKDHCDSHEWKDFQCKFVTRNMSLCDEIPGCSSNGTKNKCRGFAFKSDHLYGESG